MSSRDQWQRDRGELQGSVSSPFPVMWFVCDQCGRGLRSRYRPDRPLPACVGGRVFEGRHEPAHPPLMLTAESYDVWQIMYDRFMRGDWMLKPIIHNQNYMHFPVLSPAMPPDERAAGARVPVSR
jgi:hypothetical protein